MFTETIQWHELPQDGLPDSEMTVLVIVEGEAEATTAFYDEGEWRDAGSAMCFDDPVLRWAHLPGGERNSQDDGPLTCVSGGPIIGIQTGGKMLVRPVEAEERARPLLRAMREDHDCAQLVGAWPSIGITRDYRRATVDQVAAALTREGVPFVIAQ